MKDEKDKAERRLEIGIWGILGPTFGDSIWRFGHRRRVAAVGRRLRADTLLVHIHEVISRYPPVDYEGTGEVGLIMIRLDGMVAIITGGAGPSIGQGVSRALARCGAHVVVADRSPGAAHELADSIANDGCSAEAIELDVSSQESVTKVVEHVVKKHDRLDILVNSAGIGLIRPLADVTDREYRNLMRVDLDGVFYCCRACIPHFQQQGGGAIINIASIHALATTPNYAVYAAAKGGVAAMTRGIAVQYGKANIRANAVCPGFVDGPQSRRLIASFSDDVQGWIGAFVDRHQALPSLIQPQDVGFLVAFLSSHLARSITGAVIPVDGGTMSMATSYD